MLEAITNVKKDFVFQNYPIVAKEDEFLCKVDSVPRKEIIYVKVQAGDTLTHISRRFLTSPRDLIRLSGLQNPDFIIAGQRLPIPAAVFRDYPNPAHVRHSVAVTVRHGDTLTYYSKLFGIALKEIAEANMIKNSNKIRVGDKIKIPITLFEKEAHQNIKTELICRACIASERGGVDSKNFDIGAAIRSFIEGGEDWLKMPVSYQGKKITFLRFLLEIVVKALPRGALKLAKDSLDHPEIVAAILAFVVVLAFMPAVVSTGVLVASLGFSVILSLYSFFQGSSAWLRGDIRALEEASADFGVAIISLIMMKMFWKKPNAAHERIGKSVTLIRSQFRNNFMRAFAAVSHASDEIAATLALMASGQSLIDDSL